MTDADRRYIHCIPFQEPCSDLPIRGNVAIYIKMWAMFQNHAMFYVIDKNDIFTTGINGCIKPDYFEKAFYLPDMSELALE